MSKIEEVELDRHRHQMEHDMQALVEKYRAIFDWDVPDINQKEADRLIIQEMHDALDKAAASLSVAAS